MKTVALVFVARFTCPVCRQIGVIGASLLSGGGCVDRPERIRATARKESHLKRCQTFV